MNNKVCNIQPKITQTIAHVKRGYSFEQQNDIANLIPIVQRVGELSYSLSRKICGSVFRLRHTFSPHNMYIAPKGKTHNLMDYTTNATATNLRKYQWDYIHNPENIVGVFEDDSEGAYEIKNGSFLCYNGQFISNANILNNDAFAKFYKTSIGKSTVNLFTLKNPFSFPLYVNLAYQAFYETKYSFSLMFFDGTEWDYVSNIEEEDIENLKLCYLIQYYDDWASGISGAYDLGHEIFIHGIPKYILLKDLLISFNSLTKSEIVKRLKRIKNNGNFIGKTGGDFDHALFIEGKRVNMLKFINELLLTFPNKKSSIYESIKTELKTYSNPQNYPYINVYFKNKYGKSTIQMVKKLLMDNYSQDYNLYFKTWYDETINNFDN